ncbi:glucosaminidase domain-containing protein [Paenibacillus sacheonensis]|uniref:Uncharacterized protein n=1 Tax=Paenibacillus sacheonensis TaxID=742054 RepID=A0A7X4YKK3_9BACL|nr:glucosaminidase domain-containing protein [Paenibacillus sacheonensis]MBM7563336.1 hypothetical protein [Paenibacillus sacheonensis]NBC68108.1 hypothetical protein [Paenibacillus sacheonensis]
MYSHAAGVLTRAEIHKIRHYVQHKHADLPKERRAEILADAMQRIVLRQLPELPLELKQQVMRALLRDVVAARGMPVSKSHIFEACMKLDAVRPEVLTPLHKWAEKVLEADIDLRLFREAVEEGRRIAVAPGLGVSAWDALIGAVGSREGAGREGRSWRMTSNRAKRHPVKQRRLSIAVYLGMSLVLSGATLIYGWQLLHPKPAANVPLAPTTIQRPMPVPSLMKQKNALPEQLRFVEVDRSRLVRYLRVKSSLLAEEPYLSAIIKAAKEHDIHPLLLFAITGQEQGFVPRTAKNARKIANNPFNVFYSWKAFNTNIDESARIAGNTINRLSFERPAGVDAVQWINREYAEDVNWSTGVNSILKSMAAQIMTDKKQ